MGLSFYNVVVKRALFLTPPETAHGIAKWFFKRPALWKIFRWRLNVQDTRLRVRVGNIELPNPVGLAAGFDKNCEMSEALFRMGFGFLTLGTATLNPREGNPKPRMWRCPQRSIVNSMGLPNEGARKIASNLSKRRLGLGPIILSISGLGIDEFVKCYHELEPLTDGIELNISTPNTVGVRIFQEPDILKKLLNEIRRVKTVEKPIWVKIPPYFDDEQRDNVHNLIDVCVKAPVDGLTATNTKLVQEPRASIGTGGLSGPPIFKDMLRIVADVYEYTHGKITISACGGISSGVDAWQALAAGASSVQLYTALIYEGPGVVSRINGYLLRMLEKSGLNSLNDVTGSGLR